MNHPALDAILKPKTVAVVGASSTPGKIGYTVVHNLIKDGYQGKIFPINPSADEILGLKTYGNVLDVPEDVECAVITVPAKFVAQVVEDCGKKGIKGLIIITSGFGESGRHDLEDELVRIAQQYDTRILGPNIVGVLSNSYKMNASFAPFLPLDGKATLISQSGALLIAIDAVTFVKKVGFNKLISIGNMSDIDFADLISWLNDDEDTA